MAEMIGLGLMNLSSESKGLWSRRNIIGVADGIIEEVIVTKINGNTD